MSNPDTSTHFVFVLVKPEDARNVGATARALNTMGHSTLRLVDPQCDHLSGKAKALAHGSAPILESATVHTSLTEATADCSIRCAATARHRKKMYHYYSLEDLPIYFEERAERFEKAAIVFGGETSGLANEDVEECELVSTIPLANPHPSLNLSQAVMMYSYALSPARKAKPHTADKRLQEMQASEQQYDALRDSVETLLTRIDAEAGLKQDIARAIARLDCNDLYLAIRLRRALQNALDNA